MAASTHHQRHHHGPVHIDEAGWQAVVDQTEQEGQLLLSFVTGTASWLSELRPADAVPVQHVIDVGSGPGVGTCALAQAFPEARVTALDGSPAMLDRTTQRARRLGLDGRISTHLAELPAGLDGVAPADVIWASMSLHHIGDELRSLRLLRTLVAPHGLLAIAERADPMRVLPDDLGLGRAGLGERLDRAGADWFARMRDGLPDSVPTGDLASMLEAAGFEVVGDRLARHHIDPPAPDLARAVAAGHLRRVRDQLGELLDDDDRHTLAVLLDPDDPAGVHRRPDLTIDASRQITIARPIGGQ